MPIATIQPKCELKEKLDALKLHPRKTHSTPVDRVKDFGELNGNTGREIEKAVREIESGKYRSHAQVKTEMGL